MVGLTLVLYKNLEQSGPRYFWKHITRKKLLLPMRLELDTIMSQRLLNNFWKLDKKRKEYILIHTQKQNAKQKRKQE
jgi:hypothetical protein